VDTADPLIGTELDSRYRIEALIGRGGMASVYRATDVTLGRTVAIKMFESPSDDVDHDERHRSEIALLASISHRSLVTLFDASRDERTGREYFAMEHVDGDDLAHRLRRGPVSPADAATLLVDLGEALHVIHERGIIHRDVKPANVLLAVSTHPRRAWYAKLADFGIARVIDSARLTRTGALVGTAAYLSPEQVAGVEPAPSCDVYSLGLIVLEAMTCERAFPGNPMESAAARLRRDPEIPASVPSEWAELLRAMTAREPADRPAALEVALRAEQLHPVAPADEEGDPTEAADAHTQLLEAADAPTAPDAPTAVLAGSGSASASGPREADHAESAAPHPRDDATVPVATPSSQRSPAVLREESAATAAPLPTASPSDRRSNRIRPLAWLGLIVLAAAVAAGALLIPSMLEPTADPPDLPSVPGELGVHLDELMDSVTP
jgi:eukaryotic-like serine/threonine-protein kinase